MFKGLGFSVRGLRRSGLQGFQFRVSGCRVWGCGVLGLGFGGLAFRHSRNEGFGVGGFGL